MHPVALTILLLGCAGSLSAQAVSVPRVAVVALFPGPLGPQEQLAIAVDSALRSRGVEGVQLVGADTLIQYLRGYAYGYGAIEYTVADRRAFARTVRLDVMLELVLADSPTQSAAGLSVLCVRTGSQRAASSIVLASDQHTLVDKLAKRAEEILRELAEERAASPPANDTCY